MVHLYLLGTGTPTPTAARFGTAYALEIDDDLLLFDCGPATTHKLVKVDLWPTRIEHLFFTHHHFDHNADYPCFLLCRWDQSIAGSGRPLHVWGPPPTERITERLIGPSGAFADDWKARVAAPTSQNVYKNRGGSLPRPEPVVSVHDIGAGKVTEGPGWSVSAAPAKHVQPWLESLAYRVETAAGDIVFAGDTEPCPAVAQLACGCDVLVVNCWDHQRTMNENGEAPGQTGTLDSARMASDAGAKTLVLTHTGPRICMPGSKERAIADIARHYDGKIIFGEERLRLELW